MSFIRKYLSLLLFCGTAILYIHNLSRSVYGGDVGDLVTAAYVFGVPHPPGYPLFSLLGFFLTRFTDLFSQTPAFMVGLISAFSSAAGVMLFYVISKRLTKNELVSLLGSLILAFSYLYWFYAEIAEVFALNNFFALLLLYLSLLYRDTKNVKHLYLLSFAAGLSLTNHHMIIFLFPVYLLIVWTNLKLLLKKNKKTFLWTFLFGVGGFSLYAYVFFASLSRPVIDWANLKGVTDIQGFLELVLRTRYGTFDAGNFPTPPPFVRLVILKNYTLTLLTQLTIPVVLLSILGVISLVRKQKLIGIALLVGFILSGPFFIGYAGFPLSDSYRFGVYERFLSLSAFWFLLFFPFGLLRFTTFLGKFFTRNLFVLLFQIIFFIIPLQLFLFNFPKTNLSQVFIGDDFGYDQLKGLPSDSVLFLSSDTNLFNTWYVRYALGYRDDVTVVNALAPDVTNLQLHKINKNASTSAKDAIDAVQSLHSNIELLDSSHPVYSDLLMKGPRADFVWVPSGLNYMFLGKSETKPDLSSFIQDNEKVWSGFRVPLLKREEKAEKSLTILDIPHYYANASINTANYLVEEYQATDSAEMYFKRAFHLTPNYGKAAAALGTFYFTQKQDCKQAVHYLHEAITLQPTEKRFYYLLYITVSNCTDYQQEKEKLLQEYQAIFNTTLAEDLKKNFGSEEEQQ